jgi:hypothetical protein
MSNESATAHASAHQEERGCPYERAPSGENAQAETKKILQRLGVFGSRLYGQVRDP